MVALIKSTIGAAGAAPTARTCSEHCHAAQQAQNQGWGPWNRSGGVRHGVQGAVNVNRAAPHLPRASASSPSPPQMAWAVSVEVSRRACANTVKVTRGSFARAVAVRGR